MKAFNLQEAINGAKLVTRDGGEVAEFHYFKDCKTKFPCLYVQEGELWRCTAEGKIFEGCVTDRDLQIWTNERVFFRNYSFTETCGINHQGSYYDTIEEAKEGNDRILGKYDYILKATTIDGKTTAEIVHTY